MANGDEGRAGLYLGLATIGVLAKRELIEIKEVRELLDMLSTIPDLDTNGRADLELAASALHLVISPGAPR